MTALIGFSNKEGIILASDSQMSAYPNPTSLQLGYPKISCITFQGGKDHALIAKSGTLLTANAFEDLFQNEARHVIPDSPRFIANLAEKAMAQARTKIMSIFQDAAPWLDDSKRQQILDYDCEILLAYYFRDTPYIYSIELRSCLAELRRQPFAAIGCAANVANSVLTGFPLKDMDGNEACALAVYAIETCKANDTACGGPVQMAVIGEYPEIRPYFFDRDVMIDYETSVNQTMGQARRELAKTLAENFREHRVNRGRIYWLGEGNMGRSAPVTPQPASSVHPSSE